MRPLRVLAWPGMPAPEALAEAGRRIGAAVRAVAVASNERLESEMAANPPFDLVFPSDYLVERLAGAGRLAALDHGRVPIGRVAAWAAGAEHDPGCRVSVPFAYGTTGYICPAGASGRSWEALFNPRDRRRVGMLAEVREVVGAALIATGHTPNDADASALADARRALERQRQWVARYDSDDFIGPVLDGSVGTHHAWSGPAARALRTRPGLRYVVPEEGAVLWLTAAAVPADAPDPDRSLALLRELMDPALAAVTTERYGYATPNEPARRRLAPALRRDAVLFPDPPTLARCHVLRDLGTAEGRLANVFEGVTAGSGSA